MSKLQNNLSVRVQRTYGGINASLCVQMYKNGEKHASQIHDYENLQGVRVRVEGGISIFLYFSLVFFFCLFYKI